MMTLGQKTKFLQEIQKGYKAQMAKKDTGDWIPWDGNEFDFRTYDYKTLEPPKARPFKDADELVENMKKHGPYVRHKAHTTHMLILSWTERQVTIASNGSMYYATLAKDYVWSDDCSPCGIVEEDD